MASYPQLVVRSIGPVLLAAATAALLVAPQARAQVPTGIMAPGDTIVTAFPGVAQPTPPFPSGNPLDETFIDLNGPSLEIQRPQPLAPPSGQLVASPTVFTGRARDLGEVFAITLDDQPQPNIYAGATSAYGIQIVAPDSDGDGRPERIKVGQPGASFMAGQWGPGGTAGSIYRIDGITGAITLFTTIGANAGPGLGDVVYDPSSHQFFVSDLDTGLIYRLDWTGLITDTYDHGLVGRPLTGLPPVADDGSLMNLASPAFNAENPATWGYTQPQRRVWGMAVYGGRLYYAVADGPRVFSVGIRLDGSFANDTRWELDVAGLASTNPVSDIVFDAQGRMILAQRGAQRGSYDYSVFADPQQSSVVRYRREIPDNPATPGLWVPVPDEYAIGFRPNSRNTTGGIALGYDYDQQGRLRPGSCNEYLWTTGESLRESPFFAGVLAAGGPATVHGLQGNDHDLVRPVNDPPFSAYFTDYDGQFADPTAQGHMGDVEIWQPCLGQTGYVPPYVPPYFPPPGYTPPPGNTFNLALDKRASYDQCFAGGLGWVCTYTVRITNTGPSWYWGPITVNDWLPGAPAGATASFAVTPPWFCPMLGPSNWQCNYPPVFLTPGDSVDLYVTVTLPTSPGQCYVPNAARLVWPPGTGDANPGDDIAFAAASLPPPYCTPPTGSTTNLTVDKKGPPYCDDIGTAWSCLYFIQVSNTGTGVYSGNIVVNDTLTVPNPVLAGPGWMCTNPGPSHTCTLMGAYLNPGDSTFMWLAVFPGKAALEEARMCSITNTVTITQAPPGSPLNILATDDTATVTSQTPGPNCLPPGRHSDLKMWKGAAEGCRPTEDGNWACSFAIAIENLGTDDFFGPITVKDTFVGFTPVPPSPIFVPPVCVSDGIGAYDCSSPGAVSIPAHTFSGPLFMTVLVPDDGQVCRITNRASIVVPPAFTDANTNLFNDTDEATITLHSRGCDELRTTVEPIIIACPVERQMPNGMCCPEGQRWNGRACAPVGAPPPPPPPCPPGTTATPLGCVPAACPPGTTGTPPNCAPAACPPGTTGTPPNCVPSACPPGTTGTPPNCRPVPCPPGTTGTPPNCAPNTCPPGTTGTPPNCVPNACPPGTVGTPPNCRCPANTTGTPPNCRPLTCPQGTTGTYPNCVPNACPPGTTGTPPNCRPATCPPGTTGTPPNCVQNTCPPGTTGTPPNCVRLTCPQGTTGIYPNCVPIVQTCPQGTVGTPPNCRCPPNTTGTPPNCRPLTCPQGTTGTYPNCVPIPACPQGSVGTPPNCRCPAGTIGTPPNCRPAPLTNVPGIVPLQPVLPQTPPNVPR